MQLTVSNAFQLIETGQIKKKNETKVAGLGF